MYFVDRTAVVLKPTQFFLDWLKSLDENMPDLSLEQIRSNCSVFLVPEFDEPEEDTIGGFVFGLLGRRPEVGDIVMAEGYAFEVLRAAGFRVERVKVKHFAPEGVKKTDNE